MLKKTTALFLILASLMAAASGCAGEKSESPETTPTNQTETAEAPVEESPYDEYGLDKNLKYNGDNYVMLINAGTKMYFDSDEYSGESLNDAVFERNTAVESKLNVNISTVEGADWGSDSIDKFRLDVESGGNSYNILLAHTCSGGAPLLSSDCVLNMAELENLDFDKPWWNQYIINTLNLNNRIYFCAGDLNLTTIANMWILLFNRQMTANLGKEDPYDLVDSGKWTLDAFYEQLSGVNLDLDGNERIKVAEDQISLSGSSGLLDVFLYSCGSNTIVIGNDGPEIVLGDEKSQSILEKMVQNKVDNNWLLDAGADAVILSAFSNNRLYFIGERMGNIVKYSDCESPYGIVPFPKYDEAQENYYSLSDAEGGMLCLPVTLKGDSAEMTAAVTQMLAGKTYELVTPVYYDTVLKTRYARDERTAEMVDTIFRSVIYDFGYVYDNWVTGFQSAMWSLGKANQTSLQTFVAEKQKMAERYFAGIYDLFYEEKAE